MKNIKTISVYASVTLSFVFMGCSSLNPSTYGTNALVDLLAKEDISGSDGVTIAKELRSRNIEEIDRKTLCGIPSRKALASEARVEIIKTLEGKEIVECADILRELAIKDADPDVAVAAGVAYYSLIVSDEEKISFLKESLTSSHAQSRMRAAKALKRFGSDSEDSLIESLSKETSASAAYAMCEALADFATGKSITALEKLANDLTRDFESDKFPPTNSKISSDMLRIFVVKTVEESK